MSRLLLDSNIIIDALRGNMAARGFLQALQEDDRASSVITTGELYSGVRNSAERRTIDYLLLEFKQWPVTSEIALSAGLLTRQYHPSHGLDLLDALIAATA